MSVKEFEERERERKETEKKEKEKGGQYHDRPDVPPDQSPDLKPEDEVARRDPESKKVRDEQLAKADGHGEKTGKKLDGMEKKQEEKEKNQGKGKENERSAWTYRGPDLDGR